MRNLLLALTVCLACFSAKANLIERLNHSTRPMPVEGEAVLKKIAGGYDGCEGPLWVDDPEGGFLLYGAVHTNIAYQWRPSIGPVEFKNPSNEASAFKPAPDKPGTYIVAEQTTRRIVRYEKDGSLSMIADRFDGKAFNRPNDLVLHPDGSVWFTDPDYLFARRPHETKELAAQHVFRIDLATGEVRSMDATLQKPNGLAFSPDGKHLLVSDAATNLVYKWALHPEGRLGRRSVFAELPQNRLDGIKFDWMENLWVAATDAVFLVDPHGVVFGKIAMPGKPTAIEFGGPKRRTPFITTREAVFQLVSP